MSSKVLIVDDSATIRAGLTAAVRAMKLEPVAVESGEKALELFTAEPPSLVLLDVNMAGIDGYETARRMRAAHPEAWVPIIFLSSNEYDQDLERAIESGGDDYLVKPEGALKVIDVARAELARLAIPHAMSQVAGVVTFSSGLACYEAGRDPLPEALVKRADEALYKAKHLGRNRTVTAN